MMVKVGSMTTSAVNKKSVIVNSAARGFTLIELLVVIGIIGFMAGMITYALMGAQTDARVARTRGTIQKLNEIILQQWEEYRYRPVDMRKNSYRLANGALASMPPRVQSHLRSVVLRDAMRMEMPDRVSDLLFQPSNYVVSPHLAGGVNAFSFLSERALPHRFGLMYDALRAALTNSQHSALAATMVRLDSRGFYTSLPPLQQPQPLFVSSTLDQWQAAVQSSELLYLLVSTSSYGGSSALEMFRPSDIGDPDGDGLLEFVDAWSRPIHWLRWPAGYPSDLNRYTSTDAMDPLKTDWRYANSAFGEDEKPQTIVPLIYSGGSDEQTGIRSEFDTANPIVYARMQQKQGMHNYVDPFFVWVRGGPNNDGNDSNLRPANVASNQTLLYRQNQLGSIFNETFAADDITNHDLILEP